MPDHLRAFPAVTSQPCPLCRSGHSGTGRAPAAAPGGLCAWAPLALQSQVEGAPPSSPPHSGRIDLGPGRGEGLFCVRFCFLLNLNQHKIDRGDGWCVTKAGCPPRAAIPEAWASGRDQQDTEPDLALFAHVLCLSPGPGQWLPPPPGLTAAAVSRGPRRAAGGDQAPSLPGLDAEAACLSPLGHIPALPSLGAAASLHTSKWEEQCPDSAPSSPGRSRALTPPPHPGPALSALNELQGRRASALLFSCESPSPWQTRGPPGGKPASPSPDLQLPAVLAWRQSLSS